MVRMEMGDEYRFQLPEIEARVDESRWRSAAAVDNKGALTDHERRRDSATAGDGHGRGRRSQEQQLTCHLLGTLSAVAGFPPAAARTLPESRPSHLLRRGTLVGLAIN